MTKILLVEDDKSLREIYGVRLLAEGYDIVSAGDGEEALAMAIKERPDLIISDVMMPRISGFDMLDILRSTTETKTIKVIMMTALSSEDQRARGQALGADRYLVKSQVGIEDVVRTVHEVLADAPVAGQPAFPPQAPSNLASSPQSRPAQAAQTPPATQQRPAPSVPQRQLPQAAPQMPAPFSPQQMPASAQPQTQPLPPAPQPPQLSPSLPQPTAPFSTSRPANLGERVIHPISTVQPAANLGNRIDQELQAHEERSLNNPMPQNPQAPVASPTPPTPPPVPPAPNLQQAQEPAQNPQPPQQNSDIQFEETPLPPAPTPR